jgi:tetratricopeptide (TPR) repeat protein
MKTLAYIAILAGASLWPCSALQASEYSNCTAQVTKDASKALVAAQKWKASDGGLAATHCEALALSALGHHSEAGKLFFSIGEQMQEAPDDERAAVYAQSGESYTLARQANAARRSFDFAIARMPSHADYFLGRARVSILDQQWKMARNDLNETLAQEPNSIEALILRAMANRLLGYSRMAAIDANRAISLAPHDLSALLERGRVRASLGNVSGARTDWADAVRYAKEIGREDSPPAKEADRLLKARK